MVNEPHPAHLGPDGFKPAMGKTVLVTDQGEAWEECPFGVFEFHEYCHEHLLMLSVSREQDLGELIQIPYPGDFVEAQIDLAAWHFFHHCLFETNPAFSRVAGDISVVKIFSSI
jgi:hypothetical protein